MMRGMSDRSISVNLGTLAACGLWILSVTLLLLAWLPLDSGAAGQAAIITGCAASTATVRIYFVRTNRLLRNLHGLHEPDAPAALEVVRDLQG